jgi:hypothetical protein
MKKKKREELNPVDNGIVLNQFPFTRFKILIEREGLGEQEIATGCIFPNGKVVVVDDTSTMNVYNSIVNFEYVVSVMQLKVIFLDVNYKLQDMFANIKDDEVN